MSAHQRFITALGKAAEAATEAAAAAESQIESRRLERVGEVLRAEQRGLISHVPRGIIISYDFRRQA